MPALISRFADSLFNVAALLKTLIVLDKINQEIAFTNWRVQKQVILTSLAVVL
jgi:hypothetical protein